MSVVAGVDFGTLSVRISIFDKERGKLGSAVAEYPLHSSASDPQLKTQSHDDQMNALVRAMHEAVRLSGIDGKQIKSIALDTTGSSVIPVGENLVPLGEYYLWCDHRAAGEAAEITRAAHAAKFEGIDWCGGVYSSEWGWSKLLHWLRHNPDTAPEVGHRAGTLRHGRRHPVRRHRSQPDRRAASAPWATSGCGIRSGAAFRQRSSCLASTRCSPACAPRSPAGTTPRTRSPATCPEVGRAR